MKAQSIKNPYAQLIVRGFKTLEIRSKATQFRGDVLICASLKEVWLWEIEPKGLIDELGTNKDFLYKHKGHAIGIATLKDCRPMTEQDEQKAFCKYEQGKWAYVYENPRMLQNPFPVKGQLGLFNVDIPIHSELFDPVIKALIQVVEAKTGEEVTHIHCHEQQF